jgi:ABC-type Zn uptake system ZnuABC Zn-binding protein ZnuA
MFMKTVFRWTYLSLALLVTSPAIAQIKVVTTLPDYGALVRAIGGAQVEVRVLASATGN